MQHIRTRIRQQFVKLLAGNTDAGARVYDSRLYNFAGDNLPAIIVHTSSETIDTETFTKPRSLNRNLKVAVEVYLSATALLNMKADEIAGDIERLIAIDTELIKLCKDCRLESTDIVMNSESEKPVAVLTMIFAVLYRTKEHEPDKAI